MKLQRNRLLSLPKELIDYIFEFDGNHYYKTIYKTVLDGILQTFNRSIIYQYLANIHQYYHIYITNSKFRYFPKLNLSQYTLKHSKDYGERLMEVVPIRKPPALC
jgi:hypothetical protein